MSCVCPGHLQASRGLQHVLSVNPVPTKTSMARPLASPVLKAATVRATVPRLPLSAIQEASARAKLDHVLSVNPVPTKTSLVSPRVRSVLLDPFAPPLESLSPKHALLVL